MFDIELLRGYYKGSGIKVALIDTGIENNDKQYNIEKYYYDYVSGNVEAQVGGAICSDHGTSCSKYLLNVAPQITLYDINVENNSSMEITEYAVCKAIDFAIENKVDLINISLGFPMYSEDLYFACKRAYENNIIIISAAAHNNDLVFPADNAYTVKIIDENISGDNKEKITKISDKLYKVAVEPIYHYEYDDKSENIKISVSLGSSIACVYFTAILALYLESRPLSSRKKIIDDILGNTDIENSHQNQDSTAYNPINEKGLLSIISSYYDYSKYKNIMNKNIVGYYDLYEQKSSCFYNNENEDEKNECIDTLYLVNPLHFQRSSLNNTNFTNINHIGMFKDIECNCGNVINKNDTLREIDTPIILITGIGTDCGKFNVQLELKKQMIENELANYCITYNPLGSIFEMDFLKYPDNMPFHELIYSLNGHVKQIEDDFEYESIIIDIGGGMFPLSRINTNNFGMLYHAYLNAVSADYIIICTNTLIDIKVVEHEVNKLILLGYTNIAIVISNLTYNIMSLENYYGNIPYIEEIEKIEKSVVEYKKYFNNIPVFSFDDISKGSLYKNIMDTMTE